MTSIMLVLHTRYLVARTNPVGHQKKSGGGYRRLT